MIKSVPVAERAALVSVRDAAALLPPPTVIVGTSFVPVMVMITLRLTTPGVPLESVARTT